MRTLNLGILAHVDAGKTSLTERLLHAAGVIDEIGSVDDGTARTDTLDLERQRGITIKSAVVSFELDGTTINLIDTPGHPDFIAEVERVLNVLDGAVLVISAVEGVQPQTRVLMRALQRLGVPTLLFVNKIDRAGANTERVLREVTARLTPAAVPMGWGSGQGTRDACFVPSCPDDPRFTDRLTEVLAEHDDALLAAWVEDAASIAYGRLRPELAAQTGRALVHPVFLGSAITGAGVDALIGGITSLLPVAEGDADGPSAGTVFKIERGPAGEKIAYVRMFSGTLRVRDRLELGRDARGRVTGISVFERGRDVLRPSVEAGRIARLWGLGEVRVGDTFGSDGNVSAEHYFDPPTLETVVVPADGVDRTALHAALGQLAEQDPLIGLRQDDSREELALSLYGEVQKEVIQATLASDFGLAVEFRESATICVERPVGTGAAVEYIGQPGNPFLATVGLRVEPGAVGSGVQYRRAQEILGTLPHAFYTAVEETVHATLRQGLRGWQVTDCVVTLTHTGYCPITVAADFRGLTPLVLMAALGRAGTVVCEPLQRFRIECPADASGQVLAALARLGAVPDMPEQRGAVTVLEGEIPAARVHELQRRLPALTRGEGVLESAFARYERVHGEPPRRPRTDHNPLDRKQYLLHVERRV